MPKFGSVRFFEDFAEPRTGVKVRSGQSAELGTRPLVQVQDGPVLVQKGFELRTKFSLYQNLHNTVQNYIDYNLLIPPNCSHQNRQRKSPGA